MPSHRSVEEGEEDAIGLDDRWHVANYTYSLRNSSSWPGERTVIEALALQGELPGSVDDANWQNAPVSTFRLLPNIIKEDRLFTPLNDTISVRSLYNEEEIAFLIEINDRTESVPGGPVVEFLIDPDEQIYPDAVALQFPKEAAYSTQPVEKPLFRHGDKRHHTTIWYWDAGSIEPQQQSRTMLLDATGPNSKLKPRQGESDLSARGEWQDGRWRVIFKRPRGIESESDDLVFRQGQFIPLSFANWDGNNGEKGAKHTLTPWFWLLLPNETDYTRIYVMSAGTSLAFMLAGIILIWRVRRSRNS
jgi:DMSO reductase family type II enzyme heme b subunit